MKKICNILFSLLFIVIYFVPSTGADLLPGDPESSFSKQEASRCPIPKPVGNCSTSHENDLPVNTIRQQQIQVAELELISRFVQADTDQEKRQLAEQFRKTVVFSGSTPLETLAANYIQEDIAGRALSTTLEGDPAFGAISGQVTACGCAGIADINVLFYTIPDKQLLGSVRTDSEGKYTFSALPSGEYAVLFYGKDQGYLKQWYNNETFPDGYDALCQVDRVQVSAPEVTTGIDAFMTLGSSITGRVVNQNGNGISDVRIEVYDSTRLALPAHMIYHYSSDADGYYTLNGLPSGEYKLKFVDTGNVYIDEWHSDQPDYHLADVVSITAADNIIVQDTVLRIASGGISGQVTSDGNQGVPGISVAVYGHNYEFVQLTETAPDGTYSLHGLASGEYRLEFRGSNNLFLIQWYSGKDEYGSADTVTVIEPEVTPNINMVMQSAGSISGHVPVGVNGLSWSSVRAYDRDQRSTWSANVEANGSYTLYGLPSDSYKVKFSKNNYGFEWYQGTDSFAAADSIQVTVPDETSQVDAVRYPVSYNGAISGRVTERISGKTLAEIEVEVYDENQNSINGGFTDCYGEYSVSGLPPGEYYVLFYPYGLNYISQWYNNVQGYFNFDNAEKITLTENGTVQNIDARLEAGGVITGRVSDADTGFGISSAFALLYDSADHYVWGGFTDNNGEYIIYGVPPGNYKVKFTASDSRYQDQWYAGQPDYRRATSITVTAGNTITMIDAVLERQRESFILAPLLMLLLK